jgi:hypothetical protein
MLFSDVAISGLAYYFGTLQKTLLAIGIVVVVVMLVVGRIIMVRRGTGRRGRR